MPKKVSVTSDVSIVIRSRFAHMLLAAVTTDILSRPRCSDGWYSVCSGGSVGSISGVDGGLGGVGG